MKILDSNSFKVLFVLIVTFVAFNLYGHTFNCDSSWKILSISSENSTNPSNNCPEWKQNVTLLVFMKPDNVQLQRMKVMLLNSLAVFWNQIPNSEIIFITDPGEETFENKIKSAAQAILPANFKWSVKCTEKLPTSINVTFDRRQKQIPKFWGDNFTDSQFIGIVDTDTLFVTPVMPTDLFIDGNPIMRGIIGRASLALYWDWMKSVPEVLGLGYVANFMAYFPVIVRRQDFVKIRDFIIKHKKLKYFDQVFDNVKWKYSEFTLIGNYLWYFEHENYHWVLERSVADRNTTRSNDTRVCQYLQRRLPPVSLHWPKAGPRLKVSIERALLAGICYADRSLWQLCSQVGIPVKSVNSGMSVENVFYEHPNIFEWNFDFEDWSTVEPGIVRLRHRQRMEQLGICNYHWNSNTILKIFLTN